MNVQKDESFGVIPLSKTKGRWEVFLIQHNRSGYWGFPKGHAEPNETPQEAAFRELKEETNLELIALVKEEPLQEQYTFIMDRRRVFKQVLYYIAEVGGEVMLQKEEIHDGGWFSFPEAVARVTHQEGKTLLAQIEKMLPTI
ncbi:MAG: NUDIX domain-containing protein [Verrucomicrobia bacterium]|nr:NUDIX domain-containing protein [Verrucomicrobiota bacterium]MDE3047839.1 NUDIX domain-containing protein [Verrucomicrobiota bacterium]